VTAADRLTSVDRTADARRLRWLALASAVFTYLLIVVGGIVRVTGSGLGCPDWPLCYGQLIPPLRADALIEYTHRLTASATSPLILATTAIAWLRYRKVRWILWPATVSAGLLLVQILLGAVTVVLETPPMIVALHLGTALIILALQIAVTLVAFRRAESGRADGRLSLRAPLARQAAAAVLTVFLLLVSGALVAGSGATAACAGWPLCDGRVWPGNLLGQVQMLHRLVAALGGASVFALAWAAWRPGRGEPSTRILAGLTAAFLSAQIAVGAVTVLGGYRPEVIGLHIATAAAVWGLLVATMVLAAQQPGGQPEEQTAGSEPNHAPTAGVRPRLIDFVVLTKPWIVALLLVTTLAGMMVGGGGWPGGAIVAWTMAGGALAAGGAGALNQYIDRDLDRGMRRTARRPIPGGRVSPAAAVTFGLVACAAAFYILALAVNLLAALLALAGMLYYVILYSLVLKRTTPQNIVVGGGAGAIPPLVGWAAATGHLDWTSFLLFAVVFFWTPAHFWALALIRKREYARAGVPMLPVVQGEMRTRVHILLYAVQVVSITVILGVFLRGWLFLVLALALGAGLLVHAWRLWRGGTDRLAWRMYRFSSTYLALLFAGLMVQSLL